MFRLSLLQPQPLGFTTIFTFVNNLFKKNDRNPKFNSTFVVKNSLWLKDAQMLECPNQI